MMTASLTPPLGFAVLTPFYDHAIRRMTREAVWRTAIGLRPTIGMRLAYRLTVQMLDGTINTQPNADNILPQLINEAGFNKVRLLDEFTTVTGRIEILSAEKSGASPLGRMA